MFLLCKTETFKKFQRRRNNYYEITHRWEASGTGKSMNWLFSSFFSWNTHGIFQCYFSILLHATYITWLPGNFFFSFCSNFSVLSTSFMPCPLVPISLCFLFQVPEEVIGSAYLMSFRCQPLYRELIFCWLLTSAVWPRPRSRLNHKVYNVAVKCEADGQSSFQKICVARASMLTSEGQW